MRLPPIHEITRERVGVSLGVRKLPKRAAIGWWSDNAMSLGAAISYFTVFSLAPVLLAAISVAKLLFGREAARGAVVGELGGRPGCRSGRRSSARSR